MKIIKVIIFSIFLIAPTFILAQEQVSIENKEVEKLPFMKYNHDLGFTAGKVTGVGLSYRHWFNNTKLQNFGIQVTFNPYLANRKVQEYYGGIAFLYRLAATNNVSLFLYQSNSIEYNQSKDYFDNSINFLESTISNGLGIGVEVLPLGHLSINLMGGYHLVNRRSSELEDTTSLEFKGEVGLFYKF